MSTNPRVRSIWYQAPADGVQECIGLEVGLPKRFLRIWPQADWSNRTDFGWTMHETARCVWGADEAGRMIAHLGDRLGIVMGVEKLDDLRAYLAEHPTPPNGNPNRGS